MKKFYFMSAALATMMAFAACNKTEVAPVAESEGALGLDEDIIEIAVSNTGIGTRATRPVLSSAADNNVDKVVLAFFNAEGNPIESVVLTAVDNAQGYSVAGNVITYDEPEVEEGVPGDTDREVKTAKVKVSGLADYGSTELTIVAYGYNGDDFPYGTPTLKSGETYYEITSLGNKSGTSLEEVFAGNTTATVTANLGTAETPVYKFTSSVKIVLERQVAGMLAYFQNVPATINETEVAKITVEANGKSGGFYFPSTFLNTVDSGADAKQWMLNGYNTTTDSDVLLTFDLTGLADTDSDNILDSGFGGASAADGKKYKLANEMTNLNTDNLVCEDNTLFGGRYLIPYSKHVSTGYATLVVNFWAAGNNDTPLKTMKVTTGQYANGPSTSTGTHYDILCNNFYSIGQKVAAGSTNGDPDPGDDEDPDPEIPDDPADLSASDELTVLINDAWAVIHNMELE